MISEVDMARNVVAYLEAEKWECFKEVQLGWGSRRADIVAVRDPVIAVVECKLSLSLDVIEQAVGWKHHAHWCWVAVPRPKRGRRTGIARDVLRHYGVGMLEVREGDVYVAERPELNRKPVCIDRLKAALREEQKTWAEAGSKSGFYTEYAATCREVLERVRASPGITTKALIDGLQHHYATDASARASLLKWGARGSIKGVRVERSGKSACWFPAESGA